ncbi:efflux transporter periplasmic adaptor subunit [Pleomorphomonas diazotrophica]|uniref:Efflux transporter periplasmic adaptor subunit n=1 Tax=Pleomorphomonas diazotrophica TaxID=1166257 RepID=A0A1I4QSL5_9HYPH|nr:efflux RND transporter periplasmic adaptor subunit [Pleomorphomonas diazotrophica]PKR90448.1 efflux transporter periplasmic adaptor subunit [Pleomorphomonas diazotrophica]SFM43054.1 RND family efflux transporter, MFP subunit [Pleomorphomonas diazotrophica]
MRLVLAGLASLCLVSLAEAGSLVVQPVTVPELKAVYGRVEARDSLAARARVGGTLISLDVSEGDVVTAGQRIAVVRDDKIEFQISALDAQLKALAAQLQNAEAELGRGQTLVEKGVTTSQRLDQLRTQVDVFRNQIAAAEAQRQVVVQQGAEGDVLAPVDGKVLTVPVTKGSVLMAGETVITLGGGGFFLRLSIPERHATLLKEGAPLAVETVDGVLEGRLAKVYPQIQGGRVTADVEVSGLPTDFVDARLLVRVPVGTRQALLVPTTAIHSRSGIDTVRVAYDGEETSRTVVLGERHGEDVEILSGLSGGDAVVLP